MCHEGTGQLAVLAHTLVLGRFFCLYLRGNIGIAWARSTAVRKCMNPVPRSASDEPRAQGLNNDVGCLASRETGRLISCRFPLAVEEIDLSLMISGWGQLIARRPPEESAGSVMIRGPLDQWCIRSTMG